jgi:hypothetical protein
MAIVKATYTRKGGLAKQSIRYIEHRPGKDGARVQRTLFTAEGKVERSEAYAMIDQAAKTSYFFRFVISPDPKAEDQDKHLLLRELASKTVAALEDHFQRPVQWVATIHDDHAAHRHIHALAIVPGRLQVQDFQRMRSAATGEALAQRRHLDTTREQSREQGDGIGLELSKW